MKRPRLKTLKEIFDERRCSFGLRQMGKHAREQIILIDEINPSLKEVRQLVVSIAALYDLAAEMAEKQEAGAK